MVPAHLEIQHYITISAHLKVLVLQLPETKHLVYILHQEAHTHMAVVIQIQHHYILRQEPLLLLVLVLNQQTVFTYHQEHLQELEMAQRVGMQLAYMYLHELFLLTGTVQKPQQNYTLHHEALAHLAKEESLQQSSIPRREVLSATVMVRLAEMRLDCTLHRELQVLLEMVPIHR
jgi:hypothetical protein